MQFTTITCTVVKRVKRDRSQSIRIAHIFGEVTNPENGTTSTVQYKDCWLPFEWYNKKNQRKQLAFTEATPEEVQVYNPVTRDTEVHIKRFTFYVPDWLKSNLKPWRKQVTEQLDLFPNDDDPITIIEEQSAEMTHSSDLRALDMAGAQYMMFDSPINLSNEIQEEFDAYSYGID